MENLFRQQSLFVYYQNHALHHNPTLSTPIHKIHKSQTGEVLDIVVGVDITCWVGVGVGFVVFCCEGDAEEEDMFE